MHRELAPIAKTFSNSQDIARVNIESLSDLLIDDLKEDPQKTIGSILSSDDVLYFDIGVVWSCSSSLLLAVQRERLSFVMITEPFILSIYK